MSDEAHPVGKCLKEAMMALHDQTVSAFTDGDRSEDIISNPQSWAAWKRQADSWRRVAERLEDENRELKVRNRELMSMLSRMAGDA